MKYSACIEWLFAPESPDFANRIRLARDAGLDAVEFWKWTEKDIPAVEKALAETKLALSSLVAEPMIPLTDPASHDAFLVGLRASAEMANRLGAKVLIAQAGDDLPGRTRAEQHQALVDCLTQAADVLAGTGVVLGLEPLNTLIDHKGYFLHSTVEGLDIIDEVNRPEIRIVYDIYHSLVMGEATAEVLKDRIDRVAHVHIADHPGRNEPGSGTLELSKSLHWLFDNGYNGFVGLEYRPTADTQSSLEMTFRTLGPR
ncbi:MULTISPECIES: TIM barrel protein [Phyllobacterium]|uniref:TIM barrel protein n=1 Tax=Phyllobacterium TaxID=28100 RepID=UPI001ACA82BD|nr:TIM barrel protein [Phyllobacterium calauticae]MBN9136565.1 TIM barrel protein [Phyllobacterium sp.]MBQ9349421.1 TIM barrel protein [Phyllobacterium sp.]MBZ3694015.1 TIM barrel protein [Phyllobacterium calauticae]